MRRREIETPTYKSWRCMRRRCRDSRVHNFARYGGRGIHVCERWASFENFLADMGERPAGMTLDRIDNDGPYSPENCRWATPGQQNTNRHPGAVPRDTRLPHAKRIEHNGEVHSISEWARRLGIRRETLRNRLLRGKSPAEAIQ